MFQRSALIFITLYVVVNAHICMWAPMQRKGFAIDTPGESLCYRKQGPCGGVASEDPKTALKGGEPFTVLFQQNLNHFYIENPGHLVVDYATVADPVESDFTALGTFADYNAMNEITQTNFTMKVQIPNIDCAHCVVRVRYLSQNPTEEDHGMTFHQCADVSITKSAPSALRGAVPSVQSPATPTDPKEAECCAPAQFSIEGFESGSWRNPTSKKIYFDGVNHLVRVDTNSGEGVTARDGAFQMISNYSSGIEYYYNVHAGSCALYGLNLWSDWCFGAINQQTLQRQVVVQDQLASVWRQEGTPFVWSNLHKNCAPYSQTRLDTGENTLYSNMQLGAPDATVFAVPAACRRAEAALRMQGKALEKAPRQHAAFH